MQHRRKCLPILLKTKPGRSTSSPLCMILTTCWCKLLNFHFILTGPFPLLNLPEDLVSVQTLMLLSPAQIFLLSIFSGRYVLTVCVFLMLWHSTTYLAVGFRLFSAATINRLYSQKKLQNTKRQLNKLTK